MDEPLEKLVSVFFVGAGKCGTSWLFESCRAHPELNVGLIKEPGEFLKRGVDLDAYHRLWKGPGIRCDFSNTYFFSDEAAQGIQRYNPSARICITVRDPVSRLVSRYVFMRRNGRFSGPLSDAIVAHPEILDQCRFHKHARKWLERFAPEQMLVLRLETLQSDPQRYRAQLFDFLGVSGSDEALPAVEERLAAALPRSRLLARGTKELAELARKARLFRLIKWVKRSPLSGWLYRPLPRSYQREHLEEVPEAVQKELEEDYSMFFSTIASRGGVRVV